MKQYKLINKTTGEETLCTKVVVDGFDYYLGEEVELEMGNLKTEEPYIEHTQINPNRYSLFKRTDEQETIENSWKILATNNPSIDIGQVISDAEIANINRGIDKANGYLKDEFVIGYNTHSLTHTLSDDEVVEFMEWYKNHLVQIYDKKTKLYEIESKPRCKITSKELLQLFKEQQIKTLIYE